MTLTATRAALLHVALEDLRAGKAAQVERLPRLATAATDPALSAAIDEETRRAERQRDLLDALGCVAAGPANLWIAGILDDADRDAGSHQPGVVLDIALTGAIRKAKAAEIVSTETAIALARRESPAMLDPLVRNHAEEIASDQLLRELLQRLAG